VRELGERRLVLEQEDGTPVPPKRISYTFRKAVERAELPYLSPHGLRHTFATVALAHDGAECARGVGSCRIDDVRWRLSDLARIARVARMAVPATGHEQACRSLYVPGTQDPAASIRTRLAQRLGLKPFEPLSRLVFGKRAASCRRGDLNPHALAGTRPST
jgi:hypothetical protein